VGLRAELTRWAENVEAGSKLEAVFFRTVALPGGSVSARRPPKETRPGLTKLIAASPQDAELYSLRALEAEQQLDFTAAEADWKKCIEVAQDRGAARVALADFYHRRLRSREEFSALSLAAGELPPDSDKFLPDSQQRSWKLYERLIRLIDEQRLDPLPGATQYSIWIARYPKDTQLYPAAFKYAIAHEIYDVAEQVIAAYQRAFPGEEEFPVEARAELTSKIAPGAQALAVYERSFRPLWPAHLVTQYFALLKQTGSLRVYLDRARAGVAANPTDLASAARLFYYWQQQNNLTAAERALKEFEQRKESRQTHEQTTPQTTWTADELLTLGRLFEEAHDYDEAARNYYALYSLAGSDDAVAENALGSLTLMILTAPEQPMHFGSGNLSLYRDVASMDPHPGFLNGVLSLLFDNTDPANRAAMEEQNAAPYFRRARGAELVALFESRFPNSPRRADLRERVIEAYAVYGSTDGVIRAGTKFLADFPNAPNRTAVALRVGDAYARTNQTREEFAIYDALLAELAKRADSVPIGALSQTAARPASTPPSVGSNAPGLGQRPIEAEDRQATRSPAPPGAETRYDSVRSPDYARVLDRYVARLVSLKRLRDALAVYRREIDRNPNDPGLYDVLAAFLDQNRLGSEMEQVYQRAIAQFPDHTWEHKLARWYLRQRRQADVERITKDVVKIFSGTELDAYFQEIVHPGAPAGPAMYLQLNLYAHRRFPHYPSFVRNLLNAYSATATRDDTAYVALLREHWSDAEDLRMRFFERLSRAGRLAAELSTVRAGSAAVASAANAAGGPSQWSQAEDRNPAAVRMLAEGEAWRGHFETAAPMFLAIENNFPADAAIGRRTMAIYRSLGTINLEAGDPAAGDPKPTDTAIAAGEKLSDANPRDAQTLTRLGEMEADRDRFDLAAAYWNRIPEIEPGKADSYLEAATILWDYYRYEDALRIINEARQRFAAPAMFAYESGAILENQREYSRAIREYARGVISQPGSSAQTGSGAQRRLLALARRPELRGDIEQLTGNLVSARDPSMGAFRLRVALLRNQGRRNDLEEFLIALAGRATSPELLAAIENDGREDALARAQETALAREVAITTDPVEKLRLRLSLARFYEGRQQTAQAALLIEAVYRDNPASLGVVRATVDFYWRGMHNRNDNTKRAIDVLEESAGRAEAGYRAEFTLEAARKSIESGDTARARGFATRLLSREPYRAEYIAVMADAYARAGDDRGLRGFYDAKIRELQNAPLPQSQRTEQVAAMRRALIPVLTRTKDFSAALDQYIEVLNRYPEDETLAREAAAYASSNGVVPRLRDFYTKAASDSPKDFRWPMVLARIDTQLEDFPAAIAAYTRAAAVRPDRADLLTARLNLEERLLRFDEAGATAEKLYELTYRNPDWMVKLAEIRARQGRTADAIAALQKAWIEGRSPSPRAYFAVAQKLESWGALAEARRFGEQGMKRVTPENRDELASSVQMYARVLARLRAYDAAAAGVIAVGAPQIASVVEQYYSPEDKLKYAAWVQLQVQTHPRVTSEIGLVQGAGVGDLEAKIRFQNLMAQPAGLANRAGLPGSIAQTNLQALVQLQKQRLAFEELGAQIEAFDRAEIANAARGTLNGPPANRPPANPSTNSPPNNGPLNNRPPNGAAHDSDLMEAAAAYRVSGNISAELRVLQLQNSRAPLSGPMLDRYSKLLLASPQRFVAAAGRDTRIADGLVNYAMEHLTSIAAPPRATATQQSIRFRAIASRGQRLGQKLGAPLGTQWTNAYTALAGLYFESNAAPVRAAFPALLGDMTIGARIGKPVDRNRQLAGDLWFYYAGRYGEYLGERKQAGAEDYLAAMVEAAPQQSQPYFELAEYLRGAGDATAAAADYRNALELNAGRADAHDRLALIAVQQGRREEAIQEWKLAMAALADTMNRGPAPAKFWMDAGDALRHIGEARVGGAKLFAPLRDDADKLLRAYVHRNGSYQVDALLEGAMIASGDASTGADWIAEISRVAPDPSQFLGSIVDRPWFPEGQKSAMYARIVESAEAKVAASFGEQRGYAQSELWTWQIARARYMIDHGESAGAAEVIAALPEETRNRYDVIALEIRAAAGAGKLAAQLARYDQTAHMSAVRDAAAQLAQAGDAASARRVLEFVYNRELKAGKFDAANFLGLAEIRLEERDTAGAVALLRRASLISGAAFSTLEPAAALLEKTGHPAEAAAFLADLVRAEPWNWEAKERLAADRADVPSADALVSVAKSREAAYATRVAAALALRKMKAAALTGTEAELILLSSQTPLTEAEVSKPYFAAARLEAAASMITSGTATAAARVKLLEGAIAIDPKLEAPRLALFRAAFDARQDALAVAVANQMMPNMTNDTEFAPWVADQFAANLASTDRVAIAIALGGAHQRTGDLRAALRSYQIAEHLQPAATTRRAIDTIRMQMEIDAKNNARRPVVTDNLDQDRLVHPMIQTKVAAR
jgi:tetratricopeptide (TPR) repeat protein